MIWDIFISYRNDLEGKEIGAAIKKYFEMRNYSVYFNPDEKKYDKFTEELRDAITNCKDFVLVLTKGCKKRLLSNLPNDWVREEICLAQRLNKHMIPVLIDGVKLPEPEEWPIQLQVLKDYNWVKLPANTEFYFQAPLLSLKDKIESRPEKGELFRDVMNSNPQYDVAAEYRKAIERAKSGDSEALFELALNYYYGFVDENGTSSRNLRKAYDCLKKLSEYENPYQAFSVNMIGHLYYGGKVPRKGQSYEESFKRHLAAGESLITAAQHTAYMMSIGSGCEFDYDRTVSYYEKILPTSDNSERDNSVIYRFAEFLMEYGAFEKAAALLEKTYKTYENYSPAALLLGKIYKLGLLSHPFKPDYKKAEFYFEHAIKIGECGAEPYLELGKLYFNPTGGFPKNFRIAQENFTKAADMGNSDAQYILGYMYDHGHVEHSVEKAIHYHEMAAKQGNIASKANLALLYQQPECCNYHRAFTHAKEAAATGMSMGEFFYANLLLFGRGCEPDIDEAYKFSVVLMNMALSRQNR